MTPSDDQPIIENLYSTPLLRQQLADTHPLNIDLLRTLLEREKQEPEKRSGMAQKSNISGWRSNDDLLTWPDSCIKILTKHVTGGITALNNNRPKRKASPGKGVDMFAWANINRNGEYNSAHIHPGFHWAAVYFVSTGKPDKNRPLNGLLEFHDPRPAAGMMTPPGYEFGNKFTVEPQEGMLVIFPSWLVHNVHPFWGIEARVSIAFNIRMT